MAAPKQLVTNSVNRGFHTDDEAFSARIYVTCLDMKIYLDKAALTDRQLDIDFFFFSSSGGWGKMKVKLTTLPRIFIRTRLVSI